MKKWKKPALKHNRDVDGEPLRFWRNEKDCLYYINEENLRIVGKEGSRIFVKDEKGKQFGLLIMRR